MKGKVTLNLINLICIILTISACESKVTRSYLLGSPIYDQELILHWERKGQHITWSIYRSTPMNCYSLLIENDLGISQNGILIRQNDEWQPYVFFDSKRRATHIQTIENQPYTIESQLFSQKENDYNVRQAVRAADGTQSIFYIHYDQNWMPVHIQLFYKYQLMTLYTLDAAVVLPDWKACSTTKKQ